MKKLLVALTLVLSIFLVSCSTLSFIPTPPSMTIATTDYVNTKISQQSAQTADELLAKVKDILDESLKEEREKLVQLKEAMEKQQKDVEQVLASVTEVNATASQIREIVNRLRRELGDAKKEMADSIEVVWGGIQKLRETDAVLRTNINAIEESIAQLDLLTKELKKLTGEMQVRLNGMPQETLLQLRKVIDEYYKNK